jgi:hypothetical protein
LALLLSPQLLTLLLAVRAGGVSIGGETARAVIWVGLLYLVYRGFRLTRWLVLIVAAVSAVASGVMLLRVGQQGFTSILGVAIGALAPATGVAILLASPAVRAFFTYQLGGMVPDAIQGKSSRDLPSISQLPGGHGG